jgi:hypothetical protein
MMKNVSILVIFNNLTILNKYFLRSIEALPKNIYNFDLVLIDNTKNTYKSASEAFNCNLKKVKHSIIVFCHQDIYFNDLSFFDLSFDNLSSEICIIGAAGARNKIIYSNITHGNHNSSAGTKITRIKDVQTIDECLFATRLDLLEKIKFDEKNFDGWHLYGADLSLSASNYGFKTYVVPANVYHLSKGSIDGTFYVYFKRLLYKYKGNFSYISTSCSCESTNFLSRKVILNLRILRRKIHYLKSSSK